MGFLSRPAFISLYKESVYYASITCRPLLISFCHMRLLNHDARFNYGSEKVLKKVLSKKKSTEKCPE